jgi:hypothetical protein
MTKQEHIELLKSMGFYEESHNKWIKTISTVGNVKKGTDCAIACFYQDNLDDCYIGGNPVKNDIEGMQDIDLLEEIVGNDHCTQEEKDAWVPLFEEIISARMAITQALGTIPTQVYGLKGTLFDLTDQQVENIKLRAFNMCVEMLKTYDIPKSALEQHWAGDM